MRSIRLCIERLLDRRAEELWRRMAPFLPDEGRLLDIGCGTGHNTITIRRRRPNLHVAEADVVNMKPPGQPPPTIIADSRLPFDGGSYDCGLMLFVLHYPREPLALLREAHRVIRRRMVVLQSTYHGSIAHGILRGREFIQGSLAFHVARCTRFIGPCRSSLRPSVFMTRPLVEDLFARSGWSIAAREAQPWPLTGVSRDLYVLEKRACD